MTMTQTPRPTPSDLLARHAPAPAADAALDAVLARVRDAAEQSSSARLLHAMAPVAPVAPAVRGVPSQHGARPRRRLVLTGGIVAAAALLAVLLPATFRSADVSAAALDRLATTAAAQPATVIPDGSFLHMVRIENPDGTRGIPAYEGGKAAGDYPRTLESWTAADGTIWRHDRTAAGAEEWWRFPALAAAGDGLGRSPADLAALPTDAEALLALIRPRVQGSSSNDEAVFVFLGDALRTGYVPPEVARAMISAMARLPHIETARSRTAAGAPCLAVRYAEPERPGELQGVCFAEDTASLVGEETLQDGEVVYSSIITEREIVAALPADAARNATGDGSGPKVG